MTEPRFAPIGLAAAADAVEGAEEREGARTDAGEAARDSDGTPVGAADAEADRARAAGEDVEPRP
ncbi:hypothetical protein [Micromonospora chersina]|uniref:hypothetical protein n=1 Tax=Micromonospora chersina TaxID=47854 RepID=UPI0033EB48B7